MTRVCLKSCSVACAICVVALGVGSSARAEEIRLWSTASVEAAAVRIQDVADLSAFDAALRPALGELVVARIPAGGIETVVDLEMVRHELTRVGWNLARVRLCGSTRCTVRRTTPPELPPAAPAAAPSPPAPAAPSVPEPAVAPEAAPARPDDDSLETAVRRFLAKRLGVEEVALSTRFSAADREWLASGGVVDIELRSRGEPLGVVALEVTLSGDDGRTRRVPLSVEVAVTRTVVVAKRAINQGTRVRAGDVALEPRTFTRSSDGPANNLAAVLGREARVFVRAGELVRPQDLREPALVRRGDLVTVWSRRGGLAIKTVGRAAAAGTLGESISVKVEGSRELLEATVTGPRTVSVDGAVQVAAR